jgi:crossover junction endodeoxyribonuclease RuvC
MKTQIILGIDPGYGITGWAILEKHAHDNALVQAGCIRTPKDMPFPQRIKQIYTEISHLIQKHHPGSMAIEQVFFNKNTATALDVSQARGVVLLAAAQADIPTFNYTPLQVKNALIGHGRATKNQVITMLKFHLKTAKLPKQDDTCDAIAVALTHAYTNQALK